MKRLLPIMCALPLLLLGGCTASDAEVDHLAILKEDPIFRIDVAECEKEIPKKLYDELSKKQLIDNFIMLPLDVGATVGLALVGVGQPITLNVGSVKLAKDIKKKIDKCMADRGYVKDRKGVIVGKRPDAKTRPKISGKKEISLEKTSIVSTKVDGPVTKNLAPKPSKIDDNLPSCSGSFDKKTWTNCVGSTILPEGTTLVNTGDHYEGEWKDGKPDGQGTLTGRGKNRNFTYIGGFKNGGSDGQGTFTSSYADGRKSKYVGEWKDDKRRGQGTQTFSNGNKYVGEFKDDKFNGQGTMTFSIAGGGKYVGQWKGGKHHGEGTLTYTNGTQYVGQWKDDKRHGQGTLTYADGAKYVGQWKDGIWNGKGTLTFGSKGEFAGDKYVGEFKDGKTNGQGTYTTANGDKIVGEFKDNKRHGQSTLTYANGDKYVGEFKDDKFNGQGAIFYADGNKYVGGWKDGKYHGQGTLTYADGKMKYGIWANNEYMYTRKTTPPDPKPKKTKKRGGSGSGFFVSRMGHVITNAHVVKDCKRITIGDNANKQTPVELVSTDGRKDLALLKFPSDEKDTKESKSLIEELGIGVYLRASHGLLRVDDVKMGEEVMVAGYPFGVIFKNMFNVTTGIVSATHGIGNESGWFQLDAAVQRGNSGGPIYDQKGNVVGVVVAQLNKKIMEKLFGVFPENVNFGIKASGVRTFLDESGLPKEWSTRSTFMSTEERAKIAESQTVMVVCSR